MAWLWEVDRFTIVAAAAALLVLPSALALLGPGSSSSTQTDAPEIEPASDSTQPAGTQRLLPAWAWEPTLGVLSDGSILFHVFDEAPGDRQGLELVQRSRDDGLIWTSVTPTAAGASSLPPQTVDPILHVDRDTDRVFIAEMYFACNWLAYSDDAGATWTHDPLGCGQPPTFHDHPTVFTSKPRTVETVGYENVVHICTSQGVTTTCARSLDGGLTFGPGQSNVFPTVADSGDTTHVSVGGCGGGQTAHGVAGPQGRIYIGTDWCADGQPAVSVSEDDGLTWSAQVVDPQARVLGHDVELATDSQGNVYAAWLGQDELTHLSVSRDHGRTWSTPITVGPTEANHTRLPAIAAGAPGKVAVSLVATDAPGPADQLDGDDTWHAYLSILTGAHQGAPHVDTVQLSPDGDPLFRCSCGNLSCGLGDFLDVVIDGEGRPWAALVDRCHDACVDGSENDGDKRGAVGTLAQGPSLRGAEGPLGPLEEGS